MDRQARRRFLQGSLAFVGAGVLSGCAVPPMPGQNRPAIYRIGVLWPLAPPTFEPLRQALQELGYVEGRNLSIEYRWGEGSVDRFPEFATELVALKPDLILTTGIEGAGAARQATHSIPIVMGACSDAPEAGFVATLARPGGNITGMSFPDALLTTKRLQLLKEAFPAISRVAILWPRTTLIAGHAQRVVEATEAAAASLGLRTHTLGVSGIEDFGTALRFAQQGGAEAVDVLASAALSALRKPLIDLVAKSGLPAMFESRRWVEDGGLMGYGPNFSDLFRRAATYVDRILKGANPAELPVEQPTAFDFVINLKSARALGLTIPQSVMLQATEVIE
jgi:putative tryptophan/tyrosine transport system substrate-binding protein